MTPSPAQPEKKECNHTEGVFCNSYPTLTQEKKEKKWWAIQYPDGEIVSVEEKRSRALDILGMNRAYGDGKAKLIKVRVVPIMK